MGYLVISRRTNERIVIMGKGIEIEILISDISYDRVDVGVKAPREIKILKKETHMEDLLKHGTKSNNKSR